MTSKSIKWQHGFSGKIYIFKWWGNSEFTNEIKLKKYSKVKQNSSVDSSAISYGEKQGSNFETFDKVRLNKALFQFYIHFWKPDGTKYNKLWKYQTFVKQILIISVLQQNIWLCKRRRFQECKCQLPCNHWLKREV